MNYFNDTIAAISTAPGEAGISIIRISGSSAESIVKAIFSVDTPKIEPNRVYVKWLTDPKTHSKIDQTTVVVMKAPKSYTGEDVVEIGCHGGIALTKYILDIILKAGARLADKGEFTKRAFLNGRIDLIQAEGVIDLIKSKTEKAISASALRLGGALSKSIASIRSNLIALVSGIEASIDFSDDVEPVDNSLISCQIDMQLEKIDRLLKSADTGILLNRGVMVAIVGKPNVGKSSLFNALVRKDRAIVTELAGTTTDTIEEFIAIDGIPFLLIDTAGVCESSNAIEIEGVKRTKKAIESSDVVLVVMDGSKCAKGDDIEIIHESVDKCDNVILVINKCDVLPKSEIRDIDSNYNRIELSALSGQGISELEDMLKNAAMSGDAEQDGCMISSLRQKLSAQSAMNSLFAAQQSLSNDIEHDVLLIDLKAAIAALGMMTGEEASSEIIENIFGKFCVGK